MRIHEIEQILVEKPELFLNYAVRSLAEVAGKLCFNGFIPCPIVINNSYDKNNVIDIKNNVGDVLGSIFFSNNAVIINREDMTEDKFAAYLLDVDKDDFISGVDYVLKADYLVLKARELSQYEEKYHATSGLWGGFIHKDDADFPVYHLL
jgi:hypothetical protein